jgi:hypothetical protein
LFAYRGPWDLEAPTNVVILERSLSELPQPHPETEMLRATFATKLRVCYQELCHAREGNETTRRLITIEFKPEFSVTNVFQLLMHHGNHSIGG